MLFLFPLGPPMVVINEVYISINNYYLLIDASVTDSGSAPASGLTFNITSNYSNSNYGNTVSFGSPIVNATRILNGIIITQYDELLELIGGSDNYELHLSIGAFNDIGTINNLYNTAFSVPSKYHHYIDVLVLLLLLSFSISSSFLIVIFVSLFFNGVH